MHQRLPSKRVNKREGVGKNPLDRRLSDSFRRNSVHGAETNTDFVKIDDLNLSIPTTGQGEIK